MTSHMFYKSGDGHTCNEDLGECNLCVLDVCKVCGMAEGELTTDCPGEHSNDKQCTDSYSGYSDFRDSQGGWVELPNPSAQTGIKVDIFDILSGRSQESEAELRLRRGINKEEFLRIKAICVKHLHTST